MRKGFIFDHNKCVNCSACSAACILENGWIIHPRTIYTYNSEASPQLALTNISLACNHCEKPVCLTGCPALAFYREPVTGAVIIDDSKCIGCKYCQWNCPYDAPKFDVEKRIIGKCNLCYSGLIDGHQPACVTACPSGALDYGELSDPVIKNRIKWFPDKGINPALGFTINNVNSPLKIIPENIYLPEYSKPVEEEKNITGEWSLVMFSFLTTLSVSINIKSLISGLFPGKILSVTIILIAGLLSFFHLGRFLRAWRAMANIKSSPLSREILIFVIYTLVSCIAVIFKLQGFLIATSVIGLFLLIAIDNVYIFTDKRAYLFFHSGHTFLSALSIVSFLTGFVLPFIFVAMIRLLVSVYKMSVNERNAFCFGIRFLRIALLMISGISLVSDISYPGPEIIFLFLTGEFLDRILFYIDFDPVNINTLIFKQINAEKDEKNGC